MPASAAAIPPWIAQPADPAAHFAQGYQIGVHTGAQQAAQAFQAQQQALAERRQLMAEQQQAYEDQMNQQVMNLKAAETARKFQANQIFRARVASGEDPTRVLMELAPDMGESPTSILHAQATRDQARAMMDYRERNLQRLQRSDAARLAPKPLAAERERENLFQLQKLASDLESQINSNPTDENLKSKQKDVLDRIEIWKNQHPGGQSTEVTVDSSGNLKYVSQPGKIQPGAASQIQEQLANIKNTIVQAGSAKNALTANDVGVAGVLIDSVLNKYVSQFAPELARPEVAGHRVQLEKAVDTYIGSLSSKGMRLSASERQAIRDGLISQGMGEAAPRSSGVLDAVQKVQRLEAIAKAKTIGSALEPWMFVDLSQQDIIDLFKQKVLNQQEVEKWALQATRRQ